VVGSNSTSGEAHSDASRRSRSRLLHESRSVPCHGSAGPAHLSIVPLQARARSRVLGAECVGTLHVRGPDLRKALGRSLLLSKRYQWTRWLYIDFSSSRSASCSDDGTHGDNHGAALVEGLEKTCEGNLPLRSRPHLLVLLPLRLARP